VSWLRVLGIPRQLAKMTKRGFMRTKLRALGERIAYYEWAYGFLAEADSDIGPIAEWLIGRGLDCLPKSRSVNAKYDLVMKDGRTIEVKATSKKRKISRGRNPIYRWDVDTQLGSLSSCSAPSIAELWFFMIANFPDDAKKRRRFDVFDPKYWTVSVVTGAQLIATGVKRYVTEATLRNIGVKFIPLFELAKHV